VLNKAYGGLPSGNGGGHTQRSYSTSSPVSSEMGDLSWVYRVRMLPATEANSVSYPQRDGKWLPAKRQW